METKNSVDLESTAVAECISLARVPLDRRSGESALVLSAGGVHNNVELYLFDESFGSVRSISFCHLLYFLATLLVYKLAAIVL